MIVTLKNLQQETFTIEIDAEKTVLELKEEIFKKLGGEYIVERQKLIYSGVILLDERSLESYNIEEHKFIVVMIQRGNTQVAKEPNTVEVNDHATERHHFATDEPLNTGPQNTESAFVVGDEYNRSVEAMIEMGFDRELVERAMAASFNNPERAFEYLTDGIPDLSETLGEANSINEFLELLRQNPTLLRAALEQIGLTDPNLIQRIVDNPDAFFNMLGQPVDNATGQENLTEFTGASNNVALNTENQSNTRSAAGGANTSVRSPESYIPNIDIDLPNLASIPLTPDELSAIERIKDMGFSEDLVIQAFIACDKNEELTVNFLLTNTEN